MTIGISIIAYVFAVRLVVNHELRPYVPGVAYGLIAGLFNGFWYFSASPVLVSIICQLSVGIGSLWLLSRLDGWKYWVILIPSIGLPVVADLPAQSLDYSLRRAECDELGWTWEYGECVEVPLGEHFD